MRLTNGRAISVEHVTEADAPRVLHYLGIVSAETDFLTFGAGEFPMTEEEEAKHIAETYASGSGFLLKATVDDTIVSLAGLRRSLRPRIRHVGEFGISVLQRFWGGGVGRIMCERVLSEAAALGIRRVELKVREDNQRARQLYQKLGFQEEGRLRSAFAVADKPFDELIMALLLDERRP